MVYPSLNSIWISIIMFKIPILEPKKHKKISVVFDEGLHREYDTMKIWFYVMKENQKKSKF